MTSSRRTIFCLIFGLLVALSPSAGVGRAAGDSPTPPPKKARSAVQAAASTPVVLPAGDFNGDGKSDVAVWRPSNGVWYLRGIGRVRWGTQGDIPVPEDYDGDNRTDLAVWRPSTGEWWIRRWDGVETRQRWGSAGDVPYPGRYRICGFDQTTASIAVWRPSTGVWYVRAPGKICKVRWGTVGDVPILGNWGADWCGLNGYRDTIGVWRPSTGVWWINGSGIDHMRRNFTMAWGKAGDIPVPGFEGCHADSFPIWRPSTGLWYIHYDNHLQQDDQVFKLGEQGDLPISGDFGAAVWRPSTGEWLMRNGDSIRWGQAGDIPV